MSVPTPASSEVIVRSEVPPGLPYRQYREYLRPDFFFCCAYCTISESEAGGYRFTIDHYEPQRARPDLTDEYTNLMYACDPCNTLKGARFPAPEHQAKGYRFFRPDQDVYSDHFETDKLCVKHKTPVGYYTIRAIDLNRQSLQRLREIRIRATNCDRFVLAGILGLRKFQLDQLPPQIRGSASRTIRQMITVGAALIESIDDLLKANARSGLLDEDAEARVRARERAAALKQLERVLKPGVMKASSRRSR